MVLYTCCVLYRFGFSAEGSCEDASLVRYINDAFLFAVCIIL